MFGGYLMYFVEKFNKFICEMAPQVCDAFQGKLSLLIFVIIVAGILYYFITNFGADKKVPIGALDSDGDAEQLSRNTKKPEEVVEQQMEMTPELANFGADKKVPIGALDSDGDAEQLRRNTKKLEEVVEQQMEMTPELANFGADKKVPIGALDSDGDAEQLRRNTKKLEEVVEQQMEMTPELAMHIEPSLEEVKQDSELGKEIEDGGAGDSLEGKQETAGLTNCPDCHKIEIIKSKKQDNAPGEPLIQTIKPKNYSCCLSYIEDSSDDESIAALLAKEEREANNTLVPSPEVVNDNDNSGTEQP